MEMTLTDSHRCLAREHFERYSDHDEQRNWHAVRGRLVSTHAYYRSLKSQQNGVDPGLNWKIAEESISWREQVEAELPDCFVSSLSRPYLSIAACNRREELSRRLNGVFDPRADSTTAGFIAVLDGSPEYARHTSEYHGTTGVRWIEKVKEKDSTFFNYCRDTLGLYRAAILESGKLRHYTEVVDEDRAFQDACIGRFKCDAVTGDVATREAATCNAITAALHVRSFLTSLNYEREFAWREQLHPRIVIASNWEVALRELTFTERGEIVVAGDLFSQLKRYHQRTLLADRVRVALSSVK